MKSRFYLISVLTIATVGLLGAPAQAQEKRGARFDFAPNYFKTEQPRVPSFAEGPSKVKQGAMPRSSGFLGLDPQMLSSRPQPLPQVAARPAVPSVSSRAFIPKTAFQSSFGQPVQPLQAGQPIAMTPNAPVRMPQMAAPTAARIAAAPRHPRSSGHRPAHSIATSVAGKLKTPTHTTPEMATYGPNVGYVPGEHLPAVQTGSGTSSRADVHGRIIKK